MKTFALLLTCLLGTVYAQSIQGIDVNHNQPNINWQQVKPQGVMFVYIKATESGYGLNPKFNRLYTGATNASIIHGAYHTANPVNNMNIASGIDQANFFLDHGGNWSPDGMTLPGAVYLENIPNEPSCYGLPVPVLENWIKDFSYTYKAMTGRSPVIYTSAIWWNQCIKNNPTFGEENSLWIVNWGSNPNPFPVGWDNATFWQHANHGVIPGGRDTLFGDFSQLQAFASEY